MVSIGASSLSPNLASYVSSITQKMTNSWVNVPFNTTVDPGSGYRSIYQSKLVFGELEEMKVVHNLAVSNLHELSIDTIKGTDLANLNQDKSLLWQNYVYKDELFEPNQDIAHFFTSSAVEKKHRLYVIQLDHDGFPKLTCILLRSDGSIDTFTSTITSSSTDAFGLSSPWNTNIRAVVFKNAVLEDKNAVLEDKNAVLEGKDMVLVYWIDGQTINGYVSPILKDGSVASWQHSDGVHIWSTCQLNFDTLGATPDWNWSLSGLCVPNNFMG